MNHKKYLSLAIGASLLALLSGCTSAPKINSEFDPEEDFTQHSTFFVLPFPREIPNVDPGTIMRITPAAQSATTASLVGKGYTEVDEMDKADLVVIIHGKSVPKTEVYNSGYIPTYGAGWRYGGYPYAAYNVSTVSVDNYDEGTLIVEMHERETQKMVWVGWVTGRTKSDTSGQPERVANLITQILDKYPAKGVDASTWAAMGTE